MLACLYDGDQNVDSCWMSQIRTASSSSLLCNRVNQNLIPFISPQHPTTPITANNTDTTSELQQEIRSMMP